MSDGGEKNGFQVPWQSGAAFYEAVAFLRTIDQKRGRELMPVRRLAREIQQLFHRMAGDLDSLCARTCPGCTDNCCERALIWYDFRDLLYLNFSSDSNSDVSSGAGMPPMPARQIVKSGTRCPNLGAQGCRLPRDRRPFVCTWYICPSQKSLVTGPALDEILLEIKAGRIEMEDLFCRITGGWSMPAAGELV